MRFHTLVGILPHERELPQPLEVDVTAWIPDEPGSMLDYRDLYAAVAALAGGGCGFIEELAGAVADHVLALPPVRRVAVAVRKPNVPLPGPLDYAEVRVERDR
jgi:dihydroneopterin aldolase